MYIVFIREIFTLIQNMKYNEFDIVRMLGFLIDNIFVEFAGKYLSTNSWNTSGN